MVKLFYLTRDYFTFEVSLFNKVLLFTSKISITLSYALFVPEEFVILSQLTVRH